MIRELLEVPLWCLEHVLTRAEAERVLAICVIGSQLQTLTSLVHANLRSCRAMQDAIEGAAARKRALPMTSHALLPISEAAVESLSTSRQQLLLAIGDCLEQLQAQQPALELFISQHSVTADELENAGCAKEAARRRFLVAVETQMVHNISALLRQAAATELPAGKSGSNSSAAHARESTQPQSGLYLPGAVPLRQHCKEVWSQLFDSFDDQQPSTVVATPANVPGTGAAHHSGSSDDHSQVHLPLDRLAQSVRRPTSRQSNPLNTPHTPLVRGYAFTSSSSSATERGPSQHSPWTGASEKRPVVDVDDSQSATPPRVQQRKDLTQDGEHASNVGYDGDNDLSGTQPSTKRSRNNGVTLSELFEGTPAATPHAIESQASQRTLPNDTQHVDQLQTLLADDDGIDGDDEPETQPDADDRTCLAHAAGSQTQAEEIQLTASDTSSQEFPLALQPRFISQSRAVDMRNASSSSSSSSLSSARRMSRMHTM